MTPNCRGCLTRHNTLMSAEAEVRRLARILAKTASPSKLARHMDSLAIAKANRTMARDQIEHGHECDTKLSDEHWTRSRA